MNLRKNIMKCRFCKKEIHFLPSCLDNSYTPTDEEKMTKGNVYSFLGMKEVEITGLCERCFDLVTEEEEYDEEYK